MLNRRPRLRSCSDLLWGGTWTSTGRGRNFLHQPSFASLPWHYAFRPLPWHALTQTWPPTASAAVTVLLGVAFGVAAGSSPGTNRFCSPQATSHHWQVCASPGNLLKRDVPGWRGCNVAVEHLSRAQAGRGSIIYAGCVAFSPPCSVQINWFLFVRTVCFSLEGTWCLIRRYPFLKNVCPSFEPGTWE